MGRGGTRGEVLLASLWLCDFLQSTGPPLAGGTGRESVGGTVGSLHGVPGEDGGHLSTCPCPSTRGPPGVGKAGGGNRVRPAPAAESRCVEPV